MAILAHTAGAHGPKTMPRAPVWAVFLTLWLALGTAWAGPFEPAAGETCSHAVSKDNPAIVAWAAGVADYLPGSDLDFIWQNVANALGPAEGTSFDVVSLGRGGEITLTFDPPIVNGTGWDLAIFENGFRDTFIELAYVAVSSNGVDFVRFDGVSLTPGPVTAFGSLNPTDVDGFAGKYRQGFGTPFDLDDLAASPLVASGRLDLDAVTQVRIVDIVGDGRATDSEGRIIYDPYPTSGSAGFDLDAVGVSNGAPYPQDACAPPRTIPSKTGMPASAAASAASSMHFWMAEGVALDH
jgi:hypothetical protein